MEFHPEKAVDYLKKRLLALHDHLPEEFSILEMRLTKNRRDARLFGEDDPANRSELNRILFELDRLSLEYTRKALADLYHECSTDGLAILEEPRPSKIKATSGRMLRHVPSPYTGIKRRWAVLIGVGSYEDRTYGALPVCVFDVTRIARRLHNGGGYTEESIHVLVDDDERPTHRPTRGAILSGLEKIAKLAGEDDLLLFYYSGHGELEQEEAYLVTSDSVSGRLKDTAIPAARVEEILQASRARAKVMILDACHAGENLYSKSSEGLHPRFIERVFMRAEGIAILASCEKNQRSYTWEEKKCSAYTYFLDEALSGAADRDAKGFVSVSDIGQYVTNRMAAWTERYNYTQTPTQHIRGYGDIIVSFYKKQTESATTQEKASVLMQPQVSASSARPAPWTESETVHIGGETYILYKATVQEVEFDGTIQRSAQAQHVSSGNIVQLKQVCPFRQTSAGAELRKALKKEYRLAQKLAQYHDYPRLLREEGIADESGISPLTLVYEAWKGPTLGAVFQRPGRALTETERVSLLWSFTRICQIISVLHRENISHRAFTADTIILLDGNGSHPVLRDFGLAGHYPRRDIEKSIPIPAPEQLQNAPALALPGLRTDIYQLGVILYTLITGHPFSRTRPSAYIPIPVVIDNAIMRAVAPLPKNRWPAIMDFAAEIKKELMKGKQR